MHVILGVKVDDTAPQTLSTVGFFSRQIQNVDSSDSSKDSLRAQCDQGTPLS
jgi:hypothetical protein